jgi:DNA-binding NarL/FixJ family response regulator
MAAGWSSLAEGPSDRSVEVAREAVELLASSECHGFRARSFDLLGRSLLATDAASAREAFKQAETAFRAGDALWRLGRAQEVERSLNGHVRRLAAARGDDLSSRERQVARLAVDGLTAREIGEQLFISRRTVETHLANVYTKLGVRSKIELVRRASELALNQ